MSLLKKNMDKDGVLTDRAANKVAGLLLNVQKKFSFVMNRLVAKISLKRLKILLIIFCLLSGGYSVYIAVHAIMRPAKSIMRMHKIIVPKNVHEAAGGSFGVSDEMYNNIQNYKRYMDSLGLLIRPGLQDSMKMLEEIYHSQKERK
jgi:hypothetical protein